MNEKVLVTGAARFIRSHLKEFLVNKGFEVKAFVRYNSKNNWGRLEESPIKNEIEVVIRDIIKAKDIYEQGITHINVGTGKDLTISELLFKQ